jgi:hypothetical protein
MAKGLVMNWSVPAEQFRRVAQHRALQRGQDGDDHVRQVVGLADQRAPRLPRRPAPDRSRPSSPAVKPANYIVNRFYGDINAFLMLLAIAGSRVPGLTTT